LYKQQIDLIIFERCEVNVKDIGLSFAFVLLIAVMLVVGCKGREDYKKEIERKGMPFSQKAFFDEVRKGNRETVELFLGAGVDMDARDEDGRTALMVASEGGELEIVKLLIKKGADVNSKDVSGYTALMYVAYNGNLDIAELLIRNKADVSARDKDGWTALMFASIRKKTDMVELLKKSGAGSGEGKD
jgi:hypothetical protein